MSGQLEHFLSDWSRRRTTGFEGVEWLLLNAVYLPIGVLSEVSPN